MYAIKAGKRNEKSKLDKLDNLIHAIECENWHPSKCEHCPYGYQYWDDSGDSGFWFHNDEKVFEDALYYLKFLKENLQELQKMKNPCCDCKESGVSTTCRCDDKIKYNVWLLWRNNKYVYL